MPFTLASTDRARSKAKILKSLLDDAAPGPTLTECQAAVARCLGYRDWAGMLAADTRSPSPLDEDAGLDTWRARIEEQSTVIAEAFRLPPQVAAGIALALRLTSRSRSEDVTADVARFLPRPLRSHPTPVPAEPGQVVLQVLRWEESERGWGTRPDGFSVHASAEEMADYVKSYWNGMPDRIPDEYSRPAGDCHAVPFEPNHPVVAALKEGKVRYWQHESGELKMALNAVEYPAPLPAP